MTYKPRFQVIVGNIGTVYDGTSRTQADCDFETYVNFSRTGYGRAAGEPVYLFFHGDPIREHEPETCDALQV